MFWLGALLALGFFLWLFSDVLLPFIIGMALAYLLDPVADRLEKIGFNRLWATIAILVAALVLFVLIMLILIPVLVSQLNGFIERLPGYVSSLQIFAKGMLNSRVAEYIGVGDIEQGIDELVKNSAGAIGTFLKSLLAGGQALVNTLGLLVVAPVVAFYMLYDWDRMVARADSWMPRDHLGTIRRLAREIDDALAGFIRGQGTLCLILGLFYAAGLSIVGLNFGLLIGFTAGLISFIPYVGSIVGFIMAVGVALVQFWPDWIMVVIVGGIFAAGQFLEGNILQPRLVGSSVGVHPVWLMFALFAFGSLFGFVGMLVAVPATAAIGVLVKFAISQYVDSPLYWGAGGRPAVSGQPPEDAPDE
jgi:predicted PurR-regulated permease PerM